jgi:acetoacetyl-CoA synthetase
MAQFKDWVSLEQGHDLPDYQALWAWSVDELEEFWSAVGRFFAVEGIAEGAPVLASADMPGATWFPGASVSFAREVFRQADPSRPALVHVDETGAAQTWSWERLLRETHAIASWLRATGVGPGDRVVGYLGNRPEALTCLLACAAVGATWAVCNQDVSAEGAAVRFAQLEPTVLLTATRSRYGGRELQHGPAIEALVGALPSLAHVLLVGSDAVELGLPTASWADALATAVTGPLCVDVPFEHPLWVLFSSGTTGAPKGLVHGHGGTLLQQLAALGLHFDVQPGDRFFWFCSTSWVMWNLQVSSLLLGATAVLYDGSPTFPDAATVWRIAAAHRVTHLGVSPGLLALAEKQGHVPAVDHDLSALRVLGVTGAPLPTATARWARTGFGVPLNVISGGTDVATAFVGASPLLPEPAPGRMGPPWLGVAARTVDDRGEPVLGEVGELVITKPMPSMPLYLWDDPGMERYRETYFGAFPGSWRQGDWATFTPDVEGFVSVEVHGRSDATLNRDGVRLGTAEIYAAAEALPEVVEALVVGVERPDGSYWMPMFVHLADGCALDEQLVERVRGAIRAAASPRHVPDELVAVPGLPHTLTGKRLEVPVKRLLMGHPLADVADPAAVDDPALLAQFARS